MFNRLNINIFMIAGLLVGIVFEVLLNFGQASMSDYFNLKAFLLFIILQVSLINAGNYLLKTFNFFDYSLNIIKHSHVFQKGTIGGYVVAGIGGVELLFAKKTGVRISKRIFNGFGNAVFCKIVD